MVTLNMRIPLHLDRNAHEVGLFSSFGRLRLFSLSLRFTFYDSISFRKQDEKICYLTVFSVEV